MANKYLDYDGLIYYHSKIVGLLGGKVDKVSGKGLSTNDYTTAEKNKLAGIAAGAEVNVQSNWNETNTGSDAYILNKPTKLSQFTNDGDGTTGSAYATESYADEHGGKIDVIKVNGTTQTITNKTVNISVLTETSDIDWSLVINKIYPVGSIYMSVNNVSPQTFLGGTWQAWGAGKVPVGVDPNDSDFNAPNKTGGSKTVTLTVKQMPNHSHGLEKKVPYGVPYNNTSGTSAGNGGGTFYGEIYSPPFTVQSTGNGEAHQNMPPYLTVYMWRRVS